MPKYRKPHRLNTRLRMKLPLGPLTNLQKNFVIRWLFDDMNPTKPLNSLSMVSSQLGVSLTTVKNVLKAWKENDFKKFSGKLKRKKQKERPRKIHGSIAIENEICGQKKLEEWAAYTFLERTLKIA